MAEGVIRKLLSTEGVDAIFDLDSAGTHDYHVGKPPYPPAVTSAKYRGYDITHLVARRIRPHDFDHFDLILAMDKANIDYLKKIAPTRCKQKIELLLDYSGKYHGMEVPDPFGGEIKDYELALDMIEDGCKGLVALLVSRIRSGLA